MSSQKEITRVVQSLCALGISMDDAWALRRVSLTLRRWHELECGSEHGCIERDEKTNVPYWYNANAHYLDPHDPRAYRRVPDRKTGALKRLGKIMARYPGLTPYVQTDPRGAALYILRPGDVLEGYTPDAYYNRGIAVY